MTTSTDITTRIDELNDEIGERRNQILALRRELAGEAVDDYELTAADDTPVKLSELFGDHRELIVVHNMGRNCPYCTLWADGFSGLVDHLSDRPIDRSPTTLAPTSPARKRGSSTAPGPSTRWRNCRLN